MRGKVILKLEAFPEEKLKVQNGPATTDDSFFNHIELLKLSFVYLRMTLFHDNARNLE